MSLASLVWLLGASGTPSIPVWSGNMPPAESVRGNLCNLAVVKPDPSGAPSSRPRRSRAQDFVASVELSAGDRVYTCSNRGEWFGVAYSTPAARCGGPEKVGLDIRRITSCRSGWVHRDWVEVLTG